MRLLLIIGMLVVMLTACSPTQSDPTSAPTAMPTQIQHASAWEAFEQLAQAEHINGARIYARESSYFAAWTGADENEARIYASSDQVPARILALPATYPSDISLFNGGTGVVMLWLDQTGGDKRQLLAALFSPEIIAEFGPNPVSQQATRRYAAVQLPGGTIQAVYSTGEGLRTDLYANQVDIRSRARQPILIHKNADYPVLLRDAEDNIHLFWLENEGKDAFHGYLDMTTFPPVLVTVAQIASAPLTSSDILESFSVAFDATTAYLFWNVREDAENSTVWLASGLIDESGYGEAQGFGISINHERAMQTPYHTGVTFAATRSDDDPISSAIPASGQYEMLPVVLHLDDKIGVAFFRDGDLVGYQDVSAVQGIGGLPTITVADNNALYLSWAEPKAGEPAAIWMTHTQP